MKPVDFDHSNKILGKPVDWDEQKHGKCLGLPVLQGEETIQSCWKPSFWEAVKMLFGKPIDVVIISQRQPPISLEVN